MSARRQIDLVLDALNAGCRTSPEVCIKTGLSKKHVCAWLRELVRLEAVEYIGLLPSAYGGRKARVYEPRIFRVNTRNVRGYPDRKRRKHNGLEQVRPV